MDGFLADFYNWSTNHGRASPMLDYFILLPGYLFSFRRFYGTYTYAHDSLLTNTRFARIFSNVAVKSHGRHIIE